MFKLRNFLILSIKNSKSSLKVIVLLTNYLHPHFKIQILVPIYWINSSIAIFSTLPQAAVREAEGVAVSLEQSRKKEGALEEEGRRLAEELTDALRLVKELQGEDQTVHQVFLVLRSEIILISQVRGESSLVYRQCRKLHVKSICLLPSTG